MSMINEEDNTPAAASLHAGARPAEGMNDFDPTKSEMLAYALQVMGGMTKDDLNGFLASMQNSQHYADSIPSGAAAQNLGSIAAKPSAALSEEDITSLFEGQDISEEFVIMAKTIMESAIDARLTLEAAHLQEQYEELVEQAYEEISETMSDKIDQYLNYVISEWMEENRLALDQGVKTEITESFIEGMKNLFAEHYVDIPEDQVDAVEELADRIEDLEARLNDALEYNMELESGIEDSERDHVLGTAISDLSDDEAEKLLSLSENLEYRDVESFATSVSILKEQIESSNSFRNSSVPRLSRNTGLITEDVFLTSDEYTSNERPSSGNPISAYANHIARTSKKV